MGSDKRVRFCLLLHGALRPAVGDLAQVRFRGASWVLWQHKATQQSRSGMTASSLGEQALILCSVVAMGAPAIPVFPGATRQSLHRTPTPDRADHQFEVLYPWLGPRKTP